MWACVKGRVPPYPFGFEEKDFTYMNLMVPTPYLDPFRMLEIWYFVQFSKKDGIDEEESFYGRTNGVCTSSGGIGGIGNRSVQEAGCCRADLLSLKEEVWRDGGCRVA